MKRAHPAPAGDDEEEEDGFASAADALAAAQRAQRAAYERRLRGDGGGGGAAAAYAPARPARRTPARPPVPADLAVTDPDDDDEADDETDAREHGSTAEEDGEGDGDEQSVLDYGEMDDDAEAFAQADADAAQLAAEPAPFDLADPADATAAATHDPRACYGCRHCGERRPAQNLGELERLVSDAQTGLLTSNWNAHFRNLADRYEERIRKPANALRKTGEQPLPAWPASAIREHMLYDSYDPATRAVRTVRELDQLARIIKEEDLVRRRRNARRPNGQARRTMDKKALDQYLKVRRLQLEWERYDPRKSAFYNPDRDLSTRNMPNPVVDASHKRLYAGDHQGPLLDAYFKKRDESANARAAARRR